LPKINRAVAYLLVFCLTSTSFSSLAWAGPLDGWKDKLPTRKQVITGVATCAVAFAMLRGMMPGPTPLAPVDNRPAVVQVEKDLPKLDVIRQEMDRGVTKQDLVKMATELRTEYQKTNAPAVTPQVSGGKSYAGDFVSRVMESPKYQYTGLSIVVIESIFLGLMYRRMRTNVSDWNRRAKTAGEVGLRMKGVTEALEKAEAKLVAAMKSQSAEDRAELLKIAEGLPEANRKALEDILKAEVKPEAGKAPVDMDLAWLEYTTAYDAWQKATEGEVRVLTAAGPTDWKAAEPLSKLSGEEEIKTKVITGLDFSWRETQEFKNKLTHLDDQAKRETGSDRTPKQRVLRYLRNALFILLVPIIPLAIIQSNDRGEDNKRRIEDLNVAAAQDRTQAVQTMLPSLFRPVLWTITEVWRTEPRLASFKCPLSTKSVEEDNPDLQVVEAILFQAILESNQNVDITKPLDFRYDEKFFEKVLRKVVSLNPAANGIEAKAKDQMIADMAYKARRIFDEPKQAGMPMGDLPAGPTEEPGFNLNKKP